MSKQGRMSAGAWKACLLVVVAVAAALLLAFVLRAPDLAGPPVHGSVGIETRQEQVFGSRRVVVTAVEPGSPMALAGVVAGDLLEFERYDDAFGRASAGEAVALRLWRPSGVQKLSVVTVAKQKPADAAWAMLHLAYLLAGLGCALLVGFKRADSLACRALACFFAGSVFVGLAALAVPGPLFGLARQAGSLYYVCWGALAVFAIHYPDHAPKGLRRRIAQALPAMVTCVVFVTALAFAAASGVYIPNMQAVTLVMGALTLMVVVVATWDSWRSSEGQTRERHLWLLAALVPMALAAVGAEAVRVLAPASLHDYQYAEGAVGLASFALLAHAVLRQRVSNFAYAVNRALVFGIISLLVLVSFTATEFALERLFHTQDRLLSVAIDAGVALFVILSLQRIEHWVGQRVDRSFFSTWYEASARLRQFMATAVHIDDSSTLLSRFASAVDEYTTFTGAAIYARRSDGSFVLRHASLAGARPLVRSNDEMVLKLRQRRAAIELEGSNVALALPMKVRGEIAGFVLIGAKPLDQPYRPDEMALLAKSAHHLGLNLESLRVQELEQQVASFAQERALLEREAAALHRIVMAAALPLPEMKDS